MNGERHRGGSHAASCRSKVVASVPIPGMSCCGRRKRRAEVYSALARSWPGSASSAPQQCPILPAGVNIVCSSPAIFTPTSCDPCLTVARRSRALLKHGRAPADFFFQPGQLVGWVHLFARLLWHYYCSGPHDAMRRRASSNEDTAAGRRTLAFQTAVPSLDLAIRLRTVRASSERASPVSRMNSLKSRSNVRRSHCH